MILLMLVLAALCNVCCAHIANLADGAKIIIPVICAQQSSKQHAGLAIDLHDISRCTRNKSATDSSSINLY